MKKILYFVLCILSIVLQNVILYAVVKFFLQKYGIKNVYLIKKILFLYAIKVKNNKIKYTLIRNPWFFMQQCSTCQHVSEYHVDLHSSFDDDGNYCRFGAYRVQLECCHRANLTLIQPNLFSKFFWEKPYYIRPDVSPDDYCEHYKPT